MSFGKTKYIFISNLRPDYFAGFPGFYMSSVQSVAGTEQTFTMTILGPVGLRRRIKLAKNFMLPTVIRSIEFSQEDAALEKQKFGLTNSYEKEESKQEEQGIEDAGNGEPDKVLFNQNERLVFKDDTMTVHPVQLKHEKEECFSYICVPPLGNRAFLPAKAKAIKGLIPKLHNKLLIDGHDVTLEDGTVVTPDMVCDAPAKRQCFAFIFMPNADFLPSFLESFSSSAFNDFTSEQIDQNECKMISVYHSVPREVMLNAQYRQAVSQFGPVKHILDCPESNIPVLSKSKATFFTD